MIRFVLMFALVIPFQASGKDLVVKGYEACVSLTSDIYKNVKDVFFGSAAQVAKKIEQKRIVNEQVYKRLGELSTEIEEKYFTDGVEEFFSYDVKDSKSTPKLRESAEKILGFALDAQLGRGGTRVVFATDPYSEAFVYKVFFSKPGDNIGPAQRKAVLLREIVLMKLFEERGISHARLVDLDPKLIKHGIIKQERVKGRVVKGYPDKFNTKAYQLSLQLEEINEVVRDFFEQRYQLIMAKDAGASDMKMLEGKGYKRYIVPGQKPGQINFQVGIDIMENIMIETKTGEAKIIDP